MSDNAGRSAVPIGNLYARRDPEALGEFYLRHVDRMTVERLHEKSAIAAELAWRDKLTAELADARRWRDPVAEPPPVDVEQGESADVLVRTSFGTLAKPMGRCDVARLTSEGNWQNWNWDRDVPNDGQEVVGWMPLPPSGDGPTDGHGG